MQGQVENEEVKSNLKEVVLARQVRQLLISGPVQVRHE